MNKSELKDLVKKYFNLTEINETENTEKQVFAEATLADGTKITNMSEGDFEVGQELHVITAEGEHVLAPSGEHTTESGIVITVDEAGMITGVHHPDAEGEGSLEASEEEMSAEPPVAEVSLEKTEMAEEEEIIEEMPMEEEMGPREEIIEAIAEVVMPEIEALKAKMAEHEEKIAGYEEKMKEHMSATPASESKTATKFSKSKSIKSSEGPKYNKRRYDVTLAKLTNR